MMTDESPTWVDVKFKVEGELLLHLEATDRMRT
jgi:hypothetical protein